MFNLTAKNAESAKIFLPQRKMSFHGENRGFFLGFIWGWGLMFNLNAKSAKSFLPQRKMSFHGEAGGFFLGFIWGWGLMII